MGLHVPFASYVLVFFPSIISLLMIIYFLYCYFLVSFLCLKSTIAAKKTLSIFMLSLNIGFAVFLLLIFTFSWRMTPTKFNCTIANFP